MKYLTLEFNKKRDPKSSNSVTSTSSRSAYTTSSFIPTIPENGNTPRESSHPRSSSDDGAIIKVIDRTLLILDIFAMRARSREAVLQVELAMETYRSPRLTGLWTHLERQSGAGGVGLRGPGERQLETDKRLMRDKITRLRREIDKVSSQREMLSSSRGKEKRLGLVGYTNAGKSSFLNWVCGEENAAEAEDVLFKTLDPTTRRIDMEVMKGTKANQPSELTTALTMGSDLSSNNSMCDVMVTDTVGFVQKLPTELVAAFRSTLESVKSADVLVHVVDASNPNWKKQVSEYDK